MNVLYQADKTFRLQKHDFSLKTQVSRFKNIPDSKVHGANMGPIWGRQDPGGPHAGPMNFAIWDVQPRTFVNNSSG